MTYSDAIKKAAAWWDPTSWGSSDKPKEQPKQEESYGLDFKTTPINEYKPSKPTYTSALDRAKAINSNVARANAAG